MIDQPQQLVNDATHHLAPPPRVTVSQWADQHRILSSKSGASPGPWTTKPFQKAIFDSFSDPDVEAVAVMASTQMVKTEFLLCAIGWIIDCDPAPALIVLPRDSDVNTFSKVRLSPMIADCPTLRAKVKDQTDRHSGDTLSHKSFDGGHLTITAAGSPANLSALPIRYLLLDEIDKYVATTSEGDPIGLARKRTATFWNAKTLMCSSPTVANESRIEKAYNLSDQRVYHCPCPSCGEPQPLCWQNVVFNNSGSDSERAESAKYRCAHCGELWSDQMRWQAVEDGHWVATAPFTGTAGFHINELCSPWKRLSNVVGDFLAARRDPHRLQVWTNTSLAETWRQQGEAPDWQRLYSRRESYEIGTIPARACLLTAAVDCQRDRLEVELIAWGRGKENWSIDYRMLPGDPANVTATGPWWRAGGLHDILTASYLTEAGGRLQVMCMTVDSGDRPSLVYDFARRHPQPVFGPSGSYCPAYGCVAATKGNDAADKLISAVSNVDVARQQRGGVRIFSIGTHFAKQELFDLLRLTPIPVPEENGGGMSYPAGYCHRPAYDRTYFQGVCSETRVVRPTGKVEWVADPSIRNEPLDLFVLNRAAASIAGVDRFKEHDWQRLEHKAGTLADNTPTPCAPAPATTASGAGQSQPGRNRRPIRGRFL